MRHLQDIAPALHTALLSLHVQLGKMRTCPHECSPRLPHQDDIELDIVSAMHTQMQLVKLVSRHSPFVRVRETYGNMFTDYQSELQKETRQTHSTDHFIESHPMPWIFTWETFHNVFGLGLLHPWRRESDGMGCARDLTQFLMLDKLDASTLPDKTRVSKGHGRGSSATTTPINTENDQRIPPHIDKEHLLEIVATLQQAAYPTTPASSTSNGLPPPSSAHVHTLRLILWNLGIWEMELDTSTSQLLRLVEHHLDRLTHDPNHPFQRNLLLEDIAHGHPSPLVLSKLFASCSRFVRFNDEQRSQPKREAAFLRLFDDAVTRVTHPVFSAMLLTFRSEFMANPDEKTLHVLWYPIDIARWSTDSRLSTQLLEYGTSCSIVHSPYLYPERHFWYEYEKVLETAKRVARMSDDDIAHVRKQIQTNHMGRVLG